VAIALRQGQGNYSTYLASGGSEIDRVYYQLDTEYEVLGANTSTYEGGASILKIFRSGINKVTVKHDNPYGSKPIQGLFLKVYTIYSEEEFIVGPILEE
jgi:hypothetical protein